MLQRPTLPEKDVYTLADLAAWPDSGTWLAVLGQPIRHSLSPAMHAAALADMAARDPRFLDWRYVRFEVAPAELPAALQAFHEKGFRGLNLTVPHKVLAFGQVKKIDPAAQPVGAVNTLRSTAEGWEGFNTDGFGLAHGLADELGATLRGSHIVLLGAGGAARGAAVECLQQGCVSLSIGNRTQENLDALLQALQPLARGRLVRGFDPRQPPAGLPAGALVINATSAGLKASDPRPVDLAALPRPAGVYDMIYNPAETGLLADARARGLRAANGLSMLVHQGARALEIWSGAEVPVDAMKKAVENTLGR
jgi:shikimate dehydrogenase